MTLRRGFRLSRVLEQNLIAKLRLPAKFIAGWNPAAFSDCD
jgi:hypothetical protein